MSVRFLFIFLNSYFVEGILKSLYFKILVTGEC